MFVITMEHAFQSATRAINAYVDVQKAARFILQVTAAGFPHMGAIVFGAMTTWVCVPVSHVFVELLVATRGLAKTE